MAATDLGRRHTEDHRRAQVEVQRSFIAEFLALWLLLDPGRLDDTAPGWLAASQRLVSVWRQRSADTAVDYYRRMRLVDAPRAVGRAPAPVFDALPILDDVERRVARGNRGSVRLSRPRSGRQVAPVISWRDDDKAAKTSLIVTGPVNMKARTRRGEPPRVVNRRAVVDATGAAGRHVLNGGRKTLLTLVEADEAAVGWARVTDRDPCYFCAMLASRGPVYQSRRQASFQPHDHCACTAEPVFDRAADWPGRARQFQRVWRDVTAGHSGRDAVNAFRREYERLQRDQRRATAA